jgi:hypothetical protein
MRAVLWSWPQLVKTWNLECRKEKEKNLAHHLVYHFPFVFLFWILCQLFSLGEPKGATGHRPQHIRLYFLAPKNRIPSVPLLGTTLSRCKVRATSEFKLYILPLWNIGMKAFEISPLFNLYIPPFILFIFYSLFNWSRRIKAHTLRYFVPKNRIPSLLLLGTTLSPSKDVKCVQHKKIKTTVTFWLAIMLTVCEFA